MLLARQRPAGDWGCCLLPGIHADLAQQYRVARNTVSKALRRLADDGLVEVVPDRGTFRARN